jgi:adenylate cyclase
MISFVDVYKDKISPDVFKNKIVIVGISEAGVTDIRATPIGQIPGPLLHLTFISNFLNAEILKSSKTMDIIFIFLS